jgi:hypothetical protein
MVQRRADERLADRPRLTEVGRVRDVVLGPPGGGWDGPYGMSEPEFEFESDPE